MIGKLTGKIDSLHGSQMILDVGGVGYLVACSAHTLRLAGQIGDTTSLWTEMQVREDAISLFGFAEAVERDWFRLLTNVQGVGAKSALSVLGILSPERLVQAIASGDKAALTAADGVGPKLALRLVTELKDKVAHMALPAALPQGKGKPALSVVSSLAEDALSALLNLGYRRMEAFAAVSSAAAKLGPDAKLDALICTALSDLSAREGAA
ncbi:MAG: Holliday junction branch migration protein RuvA [Alphaproteobacteria bacterium]|nr:Holliday junction branch migration protein RuvA [Alphaproteobacteria bacterium]